MRAASSNYATDKGPINDAFDLDRLADELEQREHHLAHTNGVTSDNSNSSTTDLPVPLTLSHDNPYLSTETFSVDEFLLSRSYTSLYDLRTELREYHAQMKEELVQLINDDYEAFLSLSTDLRGEGARLERMRWPLGDMKGVITTSRGELQELLDAIQEKMWRRTALRDEKTFLHLLLKVSDSIARLESLLLISSPEQNRFDASVATSEMATSSGLEERIADDKAARNNRPKHLLRIATEFTQLQYHSEKARPSKFVDEMQWRIDRVKATLTSDLESLFSKTVLAVTSVEQPLTQRPKLSDGDKARSMSELIDCLKAYDMLALWRDAEDVLRRDVVRSFVKKTVYTGCLAGPHSPVVPHTPLPQFLSTRDTTQPRTPFTPYTAFPSRQNSYKFGDVPASVYLLDDSDDPLAGLYNKILRFVDRDLKLTMEATEQFSGKKSLAKPVTDMRALVTQSTSVPATSSDDDVDKGFNVFVNVVWDEVARAIMDELGSVVFAAGKPDEFRRNYETTQAFLRSLEYLAPSMSAVHKMRSSPRFESFTRRWQLPVYFQLRWKDMATKVEETIEASPSLSVSSKRADASTAPFKLKPTTAVWEAMCQCWSDNVYLPDLGHKFWRLTLQLLSRYRSWLAGCLQSLDAVASGKNTFDRFSPNVNAPPSRSGTPLPDAQSQSVDDSVLEQCAIVLNDVKELEQKSMELWHHSIRELLPSAIDSDENAFEDTLRQSIQTISELSTIAISQIVVILTRRCCDALAPVKSLPGQFRATSQKYMPTKASTFVPLILRPLKIFFGVGVGDGPGTPIQKWYGGAIGSDVAEGVSNRYVAHVTAMKKTEESLRRLKVGKKSGFSFFGGGSSNDDDARDEERVRQQLILDVEAFEKDAQSLDIDVRSSLSFKALSAMVRDTPRTDSAPSSAS